MIKITASRFPLAFDDLNVKDENFNITRLDLARSFMTIGHSKLIHAIQAVGITRFLELWLRVHNNIAVDSKGNFSLNSVFFTLDPSEQKTISYFLGQSLAKLYAEKKLNCKLVDHVNNHKPYIVFHKKVKSYTPKVILHKINDTAKEPDLLGFNSNSDSHILEAKGYSSGFKKDILQHAINQVSIIDKVNSKSPLTKVACFFDLSKKPFEGTIVDPSARIKQIDVSVDLKRFIINYYSIFSLESLNRKSYWHLKLGPYEFALFRIFPPFSPYVYIGVEMSIFKRVNNGLPVDINEIPSFELQKVENKQEFNFSIGTDGIILIELFATPSKSGISRRYIGDL